MKELLDTLQAWQGEGADVGRAVVVRTFGSAPRPEGAVLLYAADGRIAGSVSGGCVEGAAAEEIEHARATGHARVIRYGISDEQAWDVGLACGGTIDVLVEPAVPAAAVDAAVASLGAGGHGAAVVTPLPADSPPAEFGQHTPGEGAPPEPAAGRPRRRPTGRLARRRGAGRGARRAQAQEALRRGLSRTVELGGRSLFIEVFPVRPRLVVVGAVEVARSLVRLARELGFETVVIDGRASFATPERFPDVDRLVVGWPDEVADEIGLGPNDAVAVLTHDVKFDEPAIVEALRRGCRYVGAVGSRKTQADRRAAPARGRRDRGRARPTARSGRAGPRRPCPGRDRPRDPRRGRRRALRRLRRPDEGTRGHLTVSPGVPLGATSGSVHRMEPPSAMATPMNTTSCGSTSSKPRSSPRIAARWLTDRSAAIPRIDERRERRGLVGRCFSGTDRGARQDESDDHERDDDRGRRGKPHADRHVGQPAEEDEDRADRRRAASDDRRPSRSSTARRACRTSDR